jgi:hypothetical protein
MKTIPPSILTRPVAGLNLQPGTLADQLQGQRPTLLVFLRHFG